MEIHLAGRARVTMSRRLLEAMASDALLLFYNTNFLR